MFKESMAPVCRLPLALCRREELPHKKAGGGQGQGGGEGQGASTAVINYTYFDSARRDVAGVAQKKPKLTAADVMQQTAQQSPSKQK
jgi:hypothetical protein